MQLMKHFIDDNEYLYDKNIDHADADADVLFMMLLWDMLKNYILWLVIMTT